MEQKKYKLNYGELKDAGGAFEVSLNGMKKIIKDFHLEMKKGLRGNSGSLKMIPTYVDRPCGNEKGKFIALDMGGTNFRILELTLKGNGRISAPKVMKFSLNKRHITGDGTELFDFLAGCIKDFLSRQKVAMAEKRPLGFTFSFPVKQTGIASGSLVCWTKGFKTKGVVGRDVVRLLNEALERKGITNIDVAALANDTVGTLIAKSYEDQDCDVGVIIGTGTNACYPEKMSGIIKWKGAKPRGARMIINTEWGNFSRLALSRYDRKLDRASDNPGRQILEKMVSGMYLGEVARLVLSDLIGKKLLLCGRRDVIFNKRGLFKTEYMSYVEGDRSLRLKRTRILLKKLGIDKCGFEDAMAIKIVCGYVSNRAARISAACIASIITRIDPSVSRRHTIAIDGSVYEKHPTFSKNMKIALREIFGSRASRIKPVLAKDGSGKGAAVIAAVAAS